ncbi:growth arrest-specific protein 1 [Anoplophora glabripennis]|uniref:Growth arrest-specific protein n=1 Tax=Anoplophora glabripennis TaxID=217634 RepID=V5H417_ANOGL|nr:growth arrest-specific protein 1 [Anoplophora glabripennis]XP_018575787.1 growth arrest-specific protein 1 [Anoplophora glabripennis]
MWHIMLAVASLTGVASAIPCEEARMKCAYRMGCGMALQNYIVGCSAVLQGPYPTHCPENCQHSLIGLTSTEEGKALMNCDCSDQYCEDQKRRSEICRPQVMKTMNAPVVSCRIAQWICGADALCSTALDYYNRFCKAMFHGKKCTMRCNNSISILRRQEKAAKLQTCKCDGLEDYDCYAIQRNMDKLCFHKHSRHHNKTHHVPEDVVPTVVLASSGVKLSFSSVTVLFFLTVAAVV